MISITMDNAATNDVLARTLATLLLQRYNLHFVPQNGQIRCLAHVVNLVVQQMLSELLDVDNPDISDYYHELNKHEPFHYNPENDEEVRMFEQEVSEGTRAAEGEDKHELDDEDSDEMGDIAKEQLPVRSAVKKVNLLTFVKHPIN